MRLAFLFPLALFGMLFIGACASTARVIPEEHGQNVVIGTSYSESGAYDAALDEAKEYCEKDKKRFVMVKQNSQYQGMDKNAKAVVNTVGMMAGYHGVGHDRDDNKVEIHFKCR